MKRLFRTVCCALVIVSGASSALASDWFVDAVNGNNGNSGTTANSPWKTVTYALTIIPPGSAQTIHVAPGAYGPATGEVFPWSWRPALALIGDQGPALTNVFGVAGTPIITMESFVQGNGWTFNVDTLIQGLSFQGGTVAIQLSSNWTPVSPTLRQLSISGMSTSGIDVSSFTQFQGGAASPVLDGIAISNCPIGLNLVNTGTGIYVVTATNCSFAGSSNTGILCSAGRLMTLSLERCRVENSAGWGIKFTGWNYGTVHAVLHACTIANNSIGGIWGASASIAFTSTTELKQCTIANNASVGVRMDYAFPSTAMVQLNSSIVDGNTDDLAIASGIGPGFSTVAYCEIGDGEYTGTAGNFQANPRFVNAPAGDFHLLATSPCIDLGDPGLPIESDCSRADVGAFSFVHVPSQTYCSAKLNSCGTLPSIGAIGTPSATAVSGYTVSATGAKAHKPGLLLYSTSGRAASPFDGGLLCVAAPVRRSTSVIDGVGTPGLCNGVLALDMNAFAAGSLGGNPSPALRVVGTRVDCQYWGRDTTAGNLLSNALEYFVCQ